MRISVKLINGESSKTTNEIYLGHLVSQTFHPNDLKVYLFLSEHLADEGYSSGLRIFGDRDDDILDVVWAGFNRGLTLGGVLGIAVEVSVFFLLEVDRVDYHFSKVVVAGVTWGAQGLCAASHFNDKISFVVDSKFALVF